MRMIGRGRDVVTDAAGGLTLMDSQRIDLSISPRREIAALVASPERADLAKLQGVRAGGQSRALLAETLPKERAAGSLLHFLIDDFAGASLVAPWAWSRWRDDWRIALGGGGDKQAPSGRRPMANVCIGFRPGATSLDAAGQPRQDVHSHLRVAPLNNPDDPQGWHELPDQTSVGMRRARWTDIWLEQGLIQVRAGFQDSASSPQGARIGLHEYLVAAEIDTVSLELLALEADPRVLPYGDCLAAVPNTARLLGTLVSDIRQTVLEALPGIHGCTHLNDVLRSLADIPMLARRLAGSSSSLQEQTDGRGFS